MKEEGTDARTDSPAGVVIRRDSAFPWRRLLFWASVAAVFTTVQIQQSLHQGRLALPVIYDDISYFEDAQWRLLDVYEGGAARGIADYLHAPPHSLVSTLLAVGGFALFGFHDWVPAAMNGVIVLWVLLFLDYRGRDLPMAWLLPIALYALTWPIMGHAVIEFRPDILCAVASVSAAMLVVGGPWTDARPRRHYLAGCCAGLALLAKPTISPVTILFVLSALTAGTWTDVRLHRTRPCWTSIRRSWLRFLGTAALIAGPHYVVAGRHIWHWIYDNAFGMNAHLWQHRGGAGAQLAYYLTGSGGSVMMGSWLYAWAAIALGAGLLAWSRRDDVAAWRASATAAVGLVAFALVSIPPMKSPFFGVLLIAMFLGTSAEMLMYVSRACRSTSSVRLKQTVIVGLAGFAGVGLLGFRFPWSYSAPLGIVPTARQIQSFHQAIERIVSIVQNDPRRPLDVFFTGSSDYMNADTVTYYIYKQRGRSGSATNLDAGPRLVPVFLGKYGDHFHAEGVAHYRYKHSGRAISVSDLHILDNLEWFATAVRTADYVIAPSADYDGLIPWLPSTRIQGQVRNLIAGDPSLRLVAHLENTLGRGSLDIFRRNAPSDGSGPVAGRLN